MMQPIDSTQNDPQGKGAVLTASLGSRMEPSKSAENILKAMKEIQNQLSDIKVYNKTTQDSEIRKQYEEVQENIKSFFVKIKNNTFFDVNESKEDDPIPKIMAYNHLFSENGLKVELLCMMESELDKDLDADIILVAARRARICKDKDVLLFTCEMDFIRMLIELGDVKIANVVNIGILHHYAMGGTFTNLVYDNGTSSTTTIVNNVMNHIPTFLKDCIASNNPKLKLVLRSCHAAASKDKQIPFDLLSETAAYPIKILPPMLQTPKKNHAFSNSSDADKENLQVKDWIQLNANHPFKEGQDDNNRKKAQNQGNKNKKKSQVTNDQIIEMMDDRERLFNAAKAPCNPGEKKKKYIFIRQDQEGEKYVTKIYLPNSQDSPMVFGDFPALDDVKNFQAFAEKFFSFVLAQENLHIDPYDISLITENGVMDKFQQKGLRSFKNVLYSAKKDQGGRGSQAVSGWLGEWEDSPELPNDKQLYKKLFTSATDLKLKEMPEGSYAAQLLAKISPCTQIGFFKAYVDGYIAAPDRCIHKIAKGTASQPKTITVKL